MKRIFGILLLLALVVLTACEQDKPYVLAHTLTIFPNQSGFSRISYVEDTTFNSAGINAPLTDLYFKREDLGGEEEDLSGRPLRIIDVYKSPVRFDSSYAWEYDRRWTQYFETQPRGNYYAERMEQNRRTVVLQFPVYPGVTWNGNLFNELDAEEFFYEQVDTTVSVRGKTFENCVLVIQAADTSGFITDRYAYEIYAPEVGLIKKYDRSLIFDGPNGEFNPDESYIYLEEVVEWSGD